MGIIDFQHLHQQIKNKLFQIAYEIECFNKSGDTDICRYAETYFKSIFNIIFSKKKWHFEKAVKINQDTYDLYDLENRICIQVTSNTSQKKKDDTINSFIKKQRSNFDKLIILFISKDKPKKNNIEIDDYEDFTIIELASLIEKECKQNEIFEIRDLLLTRLEFIKETDSKTTAKRKANIKIVEKEFIRCINLEKELKKELLIEDLYKGLSNEEREELHKNPYNQFKSSRFIQRSIEDESYPNVGDDSEWCRTFMYDFYDKGILIWIDALYGTKAIINENEEWYIEEFEERDLPLKPGSTKLNVRILGKLPYKNIVHWKDGDDYYNDYHLYCKYVGVLNTPYEEIIYKYKNGLGYYWEELNTKKKIR